MKYKISLSNKESVIVDEEGYKKLVDNISSNFVVICDEIVNPSFIISITKVNDVLFDSYKEEREPSKRIVKGHIDEKTKKYVVDGFEEIS